MSAKWLYPKIPPTSTQGRSTAEESFSLESHNNLEILFREAIQNPLDARSKSHQGPVRIHLNVLNPGEYDNEYLKKILPQEFVSRLEKSKADAANLDYESASILVIEDFGTTGLLGVYDDPYEDGNYQNWNAFWFREGEGAKASGSNGGAGQGKITYFRTGEARAIFGLTVREDDNKSLLMGRGSFRRDYHFDNETQKFQRDSFWCTTFGEGENFRITPETGSDAISEFKNAFNLIRKNESGLSLVIPFVAQVDKKEAVKTALLEFYYPIAMGRLEVAIKDYVIDASNLQKSATLFLNDQEIRSMKSSFTKDYRDFIHSVISINEKEPVPVTLNKEWDKDHISEKSFPEGTLDVLRKTLLDGNIISLRCPVTVRPKKGNATESHFDVYLQVAEDIEKTEEAFIRKDLLIGGEKHIASSPYLPKSRGLTLIGDEALSSYLVMAEMPNHLIWNGSRQRLLELYKDARTLSVVRNAMPRLLSFLVEFDHKRDIKALAKYFKKPADVQKTKDKPKDNSAKPTSIKPGNPEEINSIKKAFRLDFGNNFVRVLPRSESLDPNELPITCTLEMAYEGLDQNPFNEYDPFDFDVSDTSQYPVISSGMKIMEQKENRIEFEVNSSDFYFKISGFESNVRLKARLTYKENTDEAAFGEQ